MLKISDQTVERMKARPIAELIEKIAQWLGKELRGWSAVPGSSERRHLEATCHLAHEFGMEVETDYALFAMLVITRRPEAHYFDRPEVRESMTDAARTPASKLLWLEAQFGVSHSDGKPLLDLNGRS